MFGPESKVLAKLSFRFLYSTCMTLNLHAAAQSRMCTVTTMALSPYFSSQHLGHEIERVSEEIRLEQKIVNLQ